MKNSNTDYPLTNDEFVSIYSKVPRLTVEVVLISKEGMLLTLRDIEPHKGVWHLPGGTVYYGEKLNEAVSRVAKKELGITVTKAELINYIEYPSHLEESFDYPVGIAFLVEYEGKIKTNEEASAVGWFTHLPENMHPEQGVFMQALLS